MVGEVSKSTKYTVRAVLFLSLVVGGAMLTVAVRSEDPPGVLWVFGILLTLLGLWFVIEFVRFRIKYPTIEDERAAKERLIAANREQYDLLDRMSVAHKSTKYKESVLATGIDATAVVTFLADAHRGNEFEHLVYLELKVTIGDGEPYEVRTGEYLNAASMGSMAPGRELSVKVDPADRTRVAVWWDDSLRLHL